MKHTKLIISLIVLFVNFNLTYAQEDKSESIKHFGVGLLIEQFKYNSYDYGSNISQSNKIILSYNLNKSFRIETDFAFKLMKFIEVNERYDRMYIGFGAFWMKPYKQVNLYVGMRSEFAKAKWNFGNPSPQMSIRWRIGPTAGIEYLLAERFSLGGEVGLKYILNQLIVDTDSNNDIVEDYLEIKPDFGLLMRIYF